MHKKNTLFLIISTLFLFATFITLCLFLNTNLESLLNSDDASEMMLAKLLADNGGILSRDWYYSTELRVLNTQLIRIPLFHLTSNWHTVYLLGNIIAYLILLATMYFFCRVNHIQNWFPLLCALLLLPISEYYFENVLKGIYYIPHVVISALMISLLILYGKKRSKISLLLGILLSVVAGMGGLRQLFIYYMPAFLAAFLYYWIYRDQENTTVRYYFLFSVITAVAAFAGYQVNHRILCTIYSFEDQQSVHYIRIWAETMFRIFNAWLMNLGYVQNGGIFSFSTISNFMSALLVLYAGYSVVNVIRKKEEYSAGNLFTVLFFSSSLLLFLALFCCTDMEYLPTYSLPIIFFTIPIIFIGIGNCPNQGRSYLRRNAALLFMSVLLVANGFQQYCQYKEHSSDEFINIAQFLNENGYANGYSNFWDGNVLTQLSEGNINVWVWGDLMDDVKNLDTIYPWLQYKSHDSNPPSGKVFVLMERGEDEQFSLSKSFVSDDLIYETSLHVLYGFDSMEALSSKLGMQ